MHEPRQAGLQVKHMLGGRFARKELIMTPGNKFAKLLAEVIYLAAPAMLLYAPFYPGQYSYYEVLRVFVFIITAYFAFITLTNQDGYFANKNSKYPLMFILIALIFNPLFPIHLSRESWAPIDIICGLLIIFYFVERKIYHRTNKEIREEQEKKEKEQDEEYNRIKNIRWCKTCIYFKKKKTYEDIISGYWKSDVLPPMEYLPCDIAEKNIDFWKNYYSKDKDKRTLFPKECDLWKER